MKTYAGKVTGWLLVALVLAGGALLTGVADFSGKSGILPRLFIFFLGAIIVVQVIPAMMLVGAMFKGVASLFSTKPKKVEHK